MKLTLLDAETEKRFGYKASDISSTSHKPVIFLCNDCGAQSEKNRREIKGTCRPCTVKISKEKRRLTNRDKYGTDFVAQNDSIKEKTEATCQKRYGAKAPSLSPQVMDKARQTNQRVRGVDSPMQSEEVRAKSLKTLRDRYDVENISQVASVKEKKQETSIKNRGTAWPTQSPEVVIKSLQTRFDNYGTLNPSVYGATEDELADWIRKTSKLEVDKRFILPDGKTIDIVVPELGLGIEHSGLYWHNEDSPHPRLRTYHYDKMKVANSVGTRLITIFGDEWTNRRLQVEGFLRSVLGANERRIAARQCVVTPISSETASDFIDRHHIQGSARANVGFGLFFKNELIGAMTLAPHHRINDPRIITLSRMCFAYNTTVQGGANKLLSAAVKWSAEHSIKQMFSWSDNRWSEGAVYEKMGFTLTYEHGPDYSYVHTSNPTKRLSKQSQRKRVTKCPKDMTELQWANARGLSRIWDCGKKTWKLLIP